MFAPEMYGYAKKNIHNTKFVVQCVYSPRKGEKYTRPLDAGLVKGWGTKNSWFLIVCHDYDKIISWYTEICPPV